MSTYKTYISYVVQKGAQHVHDFAVVDFSLPKFNFYLDNSSQKVVEWAKEKQCELGSDEKLIILYFFNVSNIK
ncbi:MAG: hypothetical protein ACRDE8_16875 [Ginsengibacter sp.]